MPELPEIRTTETEIYAAIKKKQTSFFSRRLGASVIGETCDRKIWYSFRWALQQTFDGRMFRLFRRGHDEEESLAKDLVAAGFQLSQINPNTGRQWDFSDEDCSHIGGLIDGAILGIPEAPKTWHVWECKTLNEKNYRKLEREGVNKAQPKHYIQTQLYMHWSKMKRCLYTGVNKNTDEIYIERIKYDEAFCTNLINRGKSIINSKEPPPRLSEKVEYFECRFCQFSNICHYSKVPAISCRTCLHSTPEPDGTWSCAKHEKTLSKKEQEEGCEKHLLIPILIKFATHCGVESKNEKIDSVSYQMEDGRVFKNGARGNKSYSSEELHVVDPKLLCDPTADALRTEFDGKVIG